MAVQRGRAVVAVGHWTTDLPSASFIIPVLNEAVGIGSLLRELRSSFPDFELVVVDGGSSDDTIDRARPLCDQLLESGAGRALQMNRGALAARGEYLFFLHADTQPGVSQAQLLESLASLPQWGFSRVRLSGDEWVYRVISCFMNWRSGLTQVATGDQMIFVTAQLFQRSGGYDEIPLMEDVAFCKRLRGVTSPCIIALPVVSSSRRWRERGVIRTVVTMWALRLAYTMGVPPQRLWQIYYGG